MTFLLMHHLAMLFRQYDSYEEFQNNNGQLDDLDLDYLAREWFKEERLKAPKNLKRDPNAEL